MDLRGAVDLYQQVHFRADTNKSINSIHHTLGKFPNQAAAGDHDHPEYFIIGDLKFAAYTGDNGNWFSLNGRALNRVTYKTLFALIGTVFGIGDGSTTFNIPDARGRCLVCIGTGAGLTARALGAAFGVENSIVVTHSHSHGHNHAHTITVANDSPDHAHNFNATNITWAGTGTGSVTRLANQGVGAGTSGATARHGHPGSTASADATVDATAAGVSGVGTNMPPSLGMNVLIKVL